MSKRVICKIVRVTGARSTEECEFIQESHSSPVFINPTFVVDRLRFVPERGTFGRIKVSGVVMSALCDIVPGEAGVIREISLHLNGDFSRTIPTRVSKVVDQSSLIRPFPMSAAFELELDEVELSTGSNYYELRASNPFPGGSFTGTVAFSTTIKAERRAVFESSREGLSGTSSDEWMLSCNPPEILSATAGGQLNAYLLKLICDNAEIERLTTHSTCQIVRGSDGDYYIGDRSGGPDYNVLSILGDGPPSLEYPQDNADTFNDGVMSGMLLGGVTFALGTLEINSVSARIKDAFVTARRDAIGVANTELIFDRTYSLPRTIEECGTAVQAVARYLNAANVREWEILELVARCDWLPFSCLSRQLQLAGMCTMEVVFEIGKHSETSLSSPVLGQLEGRTFLEALKIIAHDAKFGSVPKMAVLSRLRESFLFSPPNRRVVIQKVIDQWSSGPFGSS